MVIAAVGQICSTASLSHNLEQCVGLISKAAVGGARVLFLPEASDYIAANSQESLSLAQPESQSPFVRGIQAAAKEHRLSVNVGIHVPVSVPVSPTSPGSPPETVTKLSNRSLWIDPDGTINHRATYDKLHLFDYGLLRESATVQSGRRLTEPFPSPVGRIGSLICFDLRFPEASLALAQPGPGCPWVSSPAEVVLYPSAFTLRTGVAHWETLLRARAIETQSWVIAAAQVGRHNAKRSSYGHSIVVDPWGTVKLELGGVNDEGEAVEGAVGAVGFVDIDLDEVARVREGMPLMRRTDLYPLS
ncbi:nitrilase and fragile histidine triad fusion protein NitFhit [Sodiomyces alkalinus F11]|uniref:Nitrilase and fragile histidine triad fusion protein NitFhit n=1 Tax=Sodiomyces alkalinus (strain CBS 110278 / VKM F-3762 / F11) TaxID=1314773 RepID=A0A3N2Q906_SODAK|nr:nitrilase and fragile histidine triad fusion protein NitFhit [Sodiomyces alkalinus F11]ROT43242.1 nitrilase and fragile histidine triad fusion protein NitFhit [Sodiomyces alkalinus F11]